jgi:uncharacterized protein (TIGR03663 family)
MSDIDCGTPTGAKDAASAAARPAPWVVGPVFVAIVVLAAFLRLPDLGHRPMHADESVHAAKFGALLERGVYRYDPNEYHGPTLYYFTLIAARARGIARYADLDEAVLRSVPAVFGILLVAAHILLVRVIGFRAAAIAALLSAVSPAMVYYSRYFIQETLLAAFGFGALIAVCRYVRSPRPGWALAAGLSAGLMFATKETWVIAVASMAAAFGIAVAIERRQAAGPSIPWRRLAVHVGLAGVAGLAVSALLFSSFLTHPRGIVDSLAAYATYARRAAASPWHIHPWHFYLGLLSWSHSAGAPAWTEAAIIALSGLGAASAVRRGATGRFDPVLLLLAVYGVLMTVTYSVIPYKTPWCVVGFLHGLILLAGIGADRLVGLPARPLSRVAVSTPVAAAVFHLGWLASSASGPFASDPRNPYVYAHTGTGVFEIARGVERLARVHPDGASMPIEVISRQNLWPLPWYLRRFRAVRWETAPVNDGFHAPLILGTPEMEPAIVEKLYEWRRPGERELYVGVFDRPVDLRPQVEVRGYAAKSLWDQAR